MGGVCCDTQPHGCLSGCHRKYWPRPSCCAHGAMWWNEKLSGAGYGNRTRLAGLGSQSITTMLTPQIEALTTSYSVSNFLERPRKTPNYPELDASLPRHRATSVLRHPSLPRAWQDPSWTPRT